MDHRITDADCIRAIYYREITGDMESELAALRAENKRYRDALQTIADEDWIKHGGVKVHQRWGGIAARALAANSLPIPSE